MALATLGRGANRDSTSHDVRSWKVRTRLDEAEVGTVKEVLLDEGGTPRYLEVERDDDDRRVLLPVGHAVADAEGEVVWVPGVARDALMNIPRYDGDPASVDSDYERSVGTAWDGAYAPEHRYASPHYRGRADRRDAGHTPTKVDTLDDIGVADHDHDPRGWTVVGRDGEPIGEVDHLLGDTGIMKVTHLVVEPAHDAGDARKVLIPAGHAALEPDHERVRVDALDRVRAASFPGWAGGLPEPEHERKVHAYLDEGYAGERRYRHPRYRADHFRTTP